jgi:MFS family permease
MTADIEHTVMRKVAWRLLPFLSLGYLLNALDRFNVSIAALTMNQELGLSATAYGLAAGAFFWSYVLFQFPANVILMRLGARRWLTIIAFMWGICSAGTAMVTGETSFVVMRFLLGIAEAGFFPGVAFFMTQWFPSGHRSKAMGVFYAFGAMANVIGGPISGNLLRLHGWHGLSGWQWMFLIEGVPSCLLALACPLLIRDRPQDARWLTPDQQAWLHERLQADNSKLKSQTLSLGQAFSSPAILLLTFGYALIAFGVYGTSFFMPLMMKTMGYSNLTVAYLTAIPGISGVIGMILLSRNSDRTGERVWHAAGPCLFAALGLVGAGLTLAVNPVAAIACFCVATFGIASALPCFWNLPTAWLGPAAAAGGIAIINSFGNISGYVGPQAVGLVHDLTGTYGVPLIGIGIVMAAAGGLILWASRAAAEPALAHS